ncbi:MAG TPA: type II toxin-antitoxin system RelE/ParE family toxin [Bacteroidia bacterium]|nr:type II toxin-antitoxin system RelE/ParE family toxin [Bacteroidia bacterium]
MTRLIIRDGALTDLEAIYSWYQEERDGLGEEFLSEWEEFLEHLANYPSTGAVYRKSMRQGRLLRFPYLIMYELSDNTIVVYCIVHVKQHPGKRIRKK